MATVNSSIVKVGMTAETCRAYGDRVLKQSSIALDGAPVAWRIETVSVPPYENLRSQGDTLKIYAVARRPDRPGPRTLGYDNRYQPAKSQCIANIFLQPGGGWRYQVLGQQHSDDGRRLTVRYATAR